MKKQKEEWIAKANELLEAHVAVHDKYRALMHEYGDRYFKATLPNEIASRIEATFHEEDQTRQAYRDFINSGN